MCLTPVIYVSKLVLVILLLIMAIPFLDQSKHAKCCSLPKSELVMRGIVVLK